MNYYSYIVTRDFGFAPNPFWEYLTLATCKPHIRKVAQIEDWIFGTGSTTRNMQNQIIFLMQVTGKLSFEQYDSDPLFQCKKPVINGSLIQIHGDNIYYIDNGIWNQRNSHHSSADGTANMKHLKTDISGGSVLISSKFYYFGNNKFNVPSQFIDICSKTRDYKRNENVELCERFIDWIGSHFTIGIHGNPIDWAEYNQLTLW